MKTVLTVVGGIALCAALAGPLTVQANMLFNGGVETTLAPDQFNLVSASTTHNASALNGWTISSGAVDVVPNTYWQNTQGSYSVDLIGSPGIGTISQRVATVIGDTYLLTFDLAFNPENLTLERASTKHLVVKATSSSSVVDGTQTYNGTTGTRTKLNMQYGSQNLSFVASSTLTTISLGATLPSGLPGSFTASSVFSGPVVDNLDLELTSTGVPPGVPEPASLGLLGAGALALLRRRR